MRYVKTGERPATKPPGKRTGARTGQVPAYVKYAERAAQMVDDQQMTMDEAAAQLKVHPCTAARAYAYFHKDKIKDAALSGRRVRRRPRRRIGPEKVGRILELAGSGTCSRGEIAAKAGCGLGTVYRVLRSAAVATS